MKKKLLLFALSFCLLETFAQNQFNCSSHLNYLEQLKTNPNFKKNQDALEKETAMFIAAQGFNKAASATYIIPVVFHVIHTGGSGNISEAQIIDQINILNKEFPRQQADTALTPAPFKPFAAPFNVEFRLATKDPSGNCTNGINRVYSSLSNCSYNQDDVKALSYWPSNKYLNIWLVQSMHYAGNPSCVGGGYATFPGGLANLDGVNIRGDLISNIGTAATNSGWGNFKGRYLIHELGHWFNLRHIWGDANCGNDFVSDTPPAVIDNSGCPSFPHNANNTCGSNANGEMFTDYMDYTNGPCLNMFTAGQVARMTAAINSPISGRNNLWAPANLMATGTNDPYVYPSLCSAVPDVLPYGALVACVGDSIKFTDYSYGGLSTSRVWNFYGNPASSLTDSIVKVKYAVPGVYSVTLTKNYLSSSKTTTFTNKVYILKDSANPNYPMPFSEDFESSASFISDWTIINKNNDATTWQDVSTTSYLGASCVSISNFGASAPSTDEIISPAMDLSASQSNTLSFMLSFAAVASTNYDKLDVSISADCGQNWFQLYSKSSNNLKTIAAYQTTSFSPLPASTDWRSEKINVDDIYLSNNVRFKFSFTSGGGNNIFIDNINLAGISTVGLKNNFFTSGVNLFPNPTSNELNLTYTLKSKTAIHFQVMDILGRVCLNQTEDKINEGVNTTKINTTLLTSGVYFVNIKQNGTTIFTSKFIKQTFN